MSRSGFLHPLRGLAVPPATQLLDDGDHAEDDHEREDAVKLEVAPQDRQGAISGRASRCGGGIVAEAMGLEAGMRMGARCDEGRQSTAAYEHVGSDVFVG